MDIIVGIRRSRALLWVAGIAGFLMVATGGAATAAARYEARHQSELLEGISVGGVPVGGMDVESARLALRQRFEDPLDRPLSVEAEGRLFQTTPRELGVRTNSAGRLQEAMDLHGRIPFLRRLWHRLTGNPLGTSLKVDVRVEGKALEEFVDRVAREVDRPAQNASFAYAAGRIRITDEKPGFALDRKAAVKELRRVATGEGSLVTLPGAPVVPEIRRADITDVLVVRVGENKLAHYRGEALVREYDVATGTSSYPTPLGQFKIINKRRNPTWVNPAKFPGGWGWGLPARIGPGPGNPLGTRALDISSPGIRIHGTYASTSIGFNASHGCIRMRIAEVEELFEQVRVGTPVVIVQTAGFRPMPRQARASQPEPTAETDGSEVPGQPLSPAAAGSPSATPTPLPTLPVVGGSVGGARTG